ncbi:MAG TPA: nuclease [Anaerolineaceae bacterium]|nr:nuclease [Anaerolineaceae bacterium]
MPALNSQSSIFRWLILAVIFLMLLSSCQNQEPTSMPTSEKTPTEIAQTKQPELTATPEGISIAKIQAAAHISPYRGQEVNDVPGIVTVVDFDGFYMQSLVPDQNPDTSEGLFVFTEFVPSVRPGDEVRVDGTVEEMIPWGGYGNLSITQIRNPKVRVLSSGNDLPAPTIIGEGGRMPPTEIIDDDTNGFISEHVLFDPQNDGIDFYESLESMLVQVNNAVVVGPTNTYKEIVVLADMGANAGIRSPRGGIVIRENDYNPERIMLDDKFRETPFVNVGDFSEKPIIGVMDYDFGFYKVQVISDLDFVSGKLQAQSPLSPAEEGQLRIASYNVLNLSVIEPQRISRLGAQIVNQMGSPDILGLQEIQDDDGSVGQVAVSSDLTYQGIIDAILDAGGPQYAYADIDPIPGTDGGIPLGNIRQGFLYRVDRGLSLAAAPHGDAKTPVELSDNNGTPQLSLNPGRIDPRNPAFYSSRKPLVISFNYQGQPLFVINNHFNAKGEDRDLFGEFQPPILDSEIQRMGQAQIVHDFVAEILAINLDSRVVVLGDLNDFQFSNPIKLLMGDILQNLVLTLPEEERYAYNFEGNGQTLDHILVSDTMVEDLVSFDILHINSEFEYTARFSDHDPLIATFKMD